MSGREHQIRQCLCCRGRAPKEELLRFVCQGGALLWDTTHTVQARGLYLHDRIECLSKGFDLGRWIRALRLDNATASRIGRADVTKVLEQAYERALKRV